MFIAGNSMTVLLVLRLPRGVKAKALTLGRRSWGQVGTNLVTAMSHPDVAGVGMGICVPRLTTGVVRGQITQQRCVGNLTGRSPEWMVPGVCTDGSQSGGQP
ncbi:hypothetical protein B0H10DRAFT_1943332 [Mycena sp. CBHHK59/15]|nr:hypothetical protein B0H10DRAFT_1943332 [Mycena sp. CBHHK59/15]